jgi:hypothetical protein
MIGKQLAETINDLCDKINEKQENKQNVKDDSFQIIIK